MKIRIGFVSNSSSSSFIIRKDCISASQADKVRDHDGDGDGEAWIITEDETRIAGHTFMDNFDMETFLERIGVEENHIEWGGWGYESPLGVCE